MAKVQMMEGLMVENDTYQIGLCVHEIGMCTQFMFKSLTLRLLMTYIYIYMEHVFLMFLDHTRRRTTVGRTPLDE